MYGILINDWWGKAQPIIEGVIPGLVVLCSVRKQAKQAMKSKPVSKQHLSIDSVSAPASRFLFAYLFVCLFEFLSWLILMMNYSVEVQTEQTLSSPTYFLFMMFPSSNKNPKLDGSDVILGGALLVSKEISLNFGGVSEYPIIIPFITL